MGRGPRCALPYVAADAEQRRMTVEAPGSAPIVHVDEMLLDPRTFRRIVCIVVTHRAHIGLGAMAT